VQRTRISCHAALDKAACAPFRKEGRMKYINATEVNRKSGVAQWRDLRCAPRTSRILGYPLLKQRFSRKLFSPRHRKICAK
jgi:hypothetical protein